MNFIRSVKLQTVLFGKPEKRVSVWTTQRSTGLNDREFEKSNEIYGDVQSKNSLLTLKTVTKKVAVLASIAAVGVFILPQYAQISTLNGIYFL